MQKPPIKIHCGRIVVNEAAGGNIVIHPAYDSRDKFVIERCDIIDAHAAIGQFIAQDGLAPGATVATTSAPSAPIPMLLWCPECMARHIDTDEFETKPHHTHACQRCGLVWRPAIVPTVGVRFLPEFGPKSVVEDAKEALAALAGGS